MAELTELKCPNCGGKLDRVGDGDRASCPHCGTELVIERRAVAVGQDEGPLRCPQCGKVDRVQKVSAIYSSGVSSSTVSGWTFDSDADVGVVAAATQSQTRLSRLLGPPREPSSPDIDPFLFILWMLLLAAPGALVALVGFGSFVIFGWAGVDLLLSATGATEGALLYFIYAVLSLLGIALGAAAWVIPLRLFRKQRRSQRVWFQVQQVRWKRAMNLWGRLYYCARDDGVFIPGQTPFIPIDKLQAFLYAD